MLGEVTRKDVALSLVAAVVISVVVNLLIGFESVLRLLGFALVFGVIVLFRKSDAILLITVGIIAVGSFILEAHPALTGFAVAVLLTLLLVKVQSSMYAHAAIGMGVVCLMVASIAIIAWENHIFGGIMAVGSIASVGLGVQGLRRNDNMVR